MSKTKIDFRETDCGFSESGMSLRAMDVVTFINLE